jgi:hypothetical protein
MCATHVIPARPIVCLQLPSALTVAKQICWLPRAAHNAEAYKRLAKLILNAAPRAKLAFNGA